MWIEFTNVYGLPEGFRLEDVICAGCNSYEGAYQQPSRTQKKVKVFL